MIELVLKEMLKSKSEPLATRMQHGPNAAFDIFVAAGGVNKHLKGKVQQNKRAKQLLCL